MKVTTDEIFNIYIIGLDERGDFGFDEKSMKAMVLAASGTFHKEEYEALSKKLPANTKGEILPGERGVLKFHSSNDEVRRGMVDLVSNAEVDVYVMAYIKNEKHPKKPVRIYADMYKEILSVVATGTDAKEIQIILDKGTFISSGKARNIAKDVLGDRMGTVEVIHTKDSPFLQTNEFVIGPTSELIETGDRELVRPLMDKIRFWKNWGEK